MRIKPLHTACPDFSGRPVRIVVGEVFRWAICSPAIYSIVRWPLLFLCLFASLLMHCRSIRVSERDGLEGSFGIFGLRASLAGMPNVPESEGMVCVGLALMLQFLINQSLCSANLDLYLST
jgi:hypothetical protein